MADNKKNLQEVSGDVLASDLIALKNDLQKMKVEQSVRGIADTSQFRKMRLEIARIITEVRRRKLAEFSVEDLELRSRIRARRARLKKA